mmetsp:Transcript_24599/g.81015  ORF Transcript_24599/g.81015 Transcript_24599/m.81015 type:complete len:141 (-) Transcript_24599:1249-1671(-)
MQQVLRQIQEAVEPVLERSLTKRRRQEFLASAGPLFLCLTFIEDALRVLLRWKEQMSYMTVTMRMSGWLGGLLLIFSLVTQAPALRRPAAQPKRERDASACSGWSGPPPPLARLQPALAGVADAGHSQAVARVCSRGAHP